MIRRFMVLIVLLSLSSSVFAQRFTKPSYFRSNQWEIGLHFTSEGSQTQVYESGSSLDIDSKTGWGFSIGYNWNSHINFQYKFSSIGPDYTATIVPEDGDPISLSHDMSKTSNQLNVTWNILARKFTPFIQVGAGWTKLDSNILSAPPVVGCWWDPWWGYICNTTWKTYSTTQFSYNIGAGVRWDVSRHWFLKASYSREWVKTDNKIDFDTISADVGFRF